MTLLELMHKLPTVDCTDGYTYYLDENRNVTTFFDTADCGEAYGMEGEHYNIVSAKTKGGDEFTFALPYRRPSINPDAIYINYVPGANWTNNI